MYKKDEAIDTFILVLEAIMKVVSDETQAAIMHNFIEKGVFIPVDDKDKTLH